MPARKWKTDPGTEGPKAGRRYWITYDHGGGQRIRGEATFDGVRWFDPCGLPESTTEGDLAVGVIAWDPIPTALPPYDPDTAAEAT